MIKIVWLCPYNINNLLPEIELNKRLNSHSSSWIQNLSDGLASNPEIKLHIITHSPAVSVTQNILKNKIHFHVVKYNFPFTNKGFPGYFPLDRITGYYSFAKKARKIIKEIKPDILHVHGTEGAYFAPALKTKIPCIISIQGIISEYIKIAPSFPGYIQASIERRAIKRTRYFGCRTKFDSSFVKKVNKNAIIFNLPEALNEVFYKYRWKRPSGLSLLFVGSVNRPKGFEDLIRALIKLRDIFPHLQLKVIGSVTPTYHKYLNEIIQEHDLAKNILWLGTKSPEEIALELSCSSFFVLPSLLDNSPNSLAEAMAVGIPSIATKVGGIPSMVNDQINGMLFEKHDIDKLNDIITYLVNNSEFQDKLSENARATAYERNYPPSVAQKYIEVYKQLIK